MNCSKEDRCAKPMEKKGQLSIFMVIGIVLFLLASFFIYTQKYAIERQSEISMRESAILESDMESFQVYLQSAFEDAVYTSLEEWGSKGGFDNATTGNVPNKTFTYDVEPTEGVMTNGKTISFLYHDGNNWLDKGRSINNLTNLTESRFLSNLDETIFVEKGYEFSSEPPKVGAYLSEVGGTTTFVLEPNVHVGTEGLAFTFSNVTTQVPVGVNEILIEVKRVVDGFPVNNDFTVQGDSGDSIITCGYDDPGTSEPLSLIRITYNKPFLQHDNYNFTFLAKIEATGCTS